MRTFRNPCNYLTNDVFHYAAWLINQYKLRHVCLCRVNVPVFPMHFTHLNVSHRWGCFDMTCFSAFPALAHLSAPCWPHEPCYQGIPSLIQVTAHRLISDNPLSEPLKGIHMKVSNVVMVPDDLQPVILEEQWYLVWKGPYYTINIKSWWARSKWWRNMIIKYPATHHHLVDKGS